MAFTRPQRPLTSALAKYVPSLYTARGIPHMVFNGSSSTVNCGSNSTIDDIPNGSDFTIELWVRINSTPADSFARLICKRGTDIGLETVISNGRLQIVVYFETSNLNFISQSSYLDDTWHHVAFVYDDTTKSADIYVDGIEVSYSSQSIGVGAYVSDALRALYFGSIDDNRYFYGDIGWIRLSDVKRYTSSFTPAGRSSPPEVDANTVEQWDADDGSGDTLTCEVNTPTNNGSMTDVTWARS
jgi:hypothetical protein